MTQKTPVKIAIIGAGAAGLMCAIEAGKKGHHVTVFDHAKKPAEKIRISGGGRCNFTNKYCTPENFISNNPHFCKSPLSRYTAENFISLVEEYDIDYHEKRPEKKTGQLFCDGKSQQIIDMLLSECAAVDVRIKLETTIDTLTQNQDDFTLLINDQKHDFDKVVIATGGPSIPKMGASDFGYRIARQFGLKIVPTEPALVPLTFTDDLLNFTKLLSGVAIDSVLIRSDSYHFNDDMLFTHRGMSGPAILQISSYWNAGENLKIDLLNNIDFMAVLKQAKKDQPKTRVQKFLNTLLPARFVDALFDRILSEEDKQKNLADFSDKKFQLLNDHIQNWIIKPNGSEGYRTAEVTRGGVDTNEINNKTFESKKVSGLYFIGEVMDVTGHLGGHNFQWAWASGYCCGQEI
jgi:predicted Rossmann fold flavoprotein